MLTVADDWFSRRDLGFIHRLFLTDLIIFQYDQILFSTLGPTLLTLLVSFSALALRLVAYLLCFCVRGLTAQLLCQWHFELNLRIS